MKPRILFVDDDAHIVQGLKRMLFPQKRDWDVQYCESGDEALDIMSQGKVDIVVSDMIMPVMDGSRLLNIVKNKYPFTIRIILSGHSDEEKSMNSVNSAHQFISKPCNSDELREKIGKAIKLSDKLQNKDLIELINGIESLPSLPEIYHQLNDEISKDEISIRKISDIISNDPPMTLKILKIVNSSFFGIPTEIRNPYQAINLLGINTLKSLILQIGIFEEFQDKRYKDLYEFLWKHSFSVANLAKKIYVNETNHKSKGEDAFVAGLLHDIGKLLLLKFDEYYDIFCENIANNKNLLELEKKHFNLTHSDIGAYLLGIWNIPDKIQNIVHDHHNLGEINFEKNRMMSSVIIANIIVNDEEFCLIELEKIIGGEKLKSLQSLQ